MKKVLKTTDISSSETKIRAIVRDEIGKTKPKWASKMEIELRTAMKDEIEKTKPRWAYKMENELLDKIDNMVTNEKFDEFKDRVLTGFDGVMGELKAIREDQTISAYRQSDHTDKLENHENRISKLEKPKTPGIL